ncbi:DUF2059 domain-containing protein [Psychroflexus tropicus]|uniref:DUF2059 domain-containing protein n=1 Tax=Psychroflexus tropicus TaxID=197345 RepID=UPI0003670CCE|nr:DUF2059 domain-containing protein [Psychroflexus tropicus]
MKKSILIIALLIGSTFTLQAQNNEAFKQDAIQLAKMGSKAAEASLDQVYKMIPEDKVGAFKKELEPIMQNFYRKLGEKSMEFYTHEQVKEILKFYNSDIGQKHLEAQEKLTKISVGTMAQELQMELMPVMQKYMTGN